MQAGRSHTHTYTHIRRTGPTSSSLYTTPLHTSGQNVCRLSVPVCGAILISPLYPYLASSLPSTKTRLDVASSHGYHFLGSAEKAASLRLWVGDSWAYQWLEFVCVYVSNPFCRLLFGQSLRLAARPGGMWFGLGCFVLPTDHAVGANALIPFTGCVVVTILCGVCMSVCGRAIVHYCTVELCEGGGSGNVLLLKASC